MSDTDALPWRYHRLIALAASVMGGILAALSVHTALVRIPRLMTVYQDFGAELPPLTLLVLRYPWTPVIPSFMALALASVAAAAPRCGWPVVVAALLVLVFSLVLTAVYEYAMELPLVYLISSVSS